MFSQAARTLASLVLDSDLQMGRIYPSLTRIREVSAAIGAAVAEMAWKDGTGRAPRPAGNLLEHVRNAIWKPEYREYLAK